MPQESIKIIIEKKKTRALELCATQKKRHFDYILPLTANVSILYHHFICHTTSLANSVSDFDNRFSVLLNNLPQNIRQCSSEQQQETRRIRKM
jgi:hypothetical protein